MAEIKNIMGTGAELKNLTEGKTSDRDVSNVQKTATDASGTKIPVGQPGDAQQADIKPGQKILADAVLGKEASQLDAAQRLSLLGGSSAVDKLLGLDVRPTMLGALVAPPGNSDFLRHLSPTKRRTIMRNMLSRQRKRMRRLARFLREERDNENSDEQHKENRREESFLEVITEPLMLEESEVGRAIDELGRTARMLDVLDELLAMQDYTISQIGTFSQG